VLDSSDARPLRASSSFQSSDLMPRVSQIHLNYEEMENQLRTTQDVLAVEQENHRDMRVIECFQHTDVSVYGGKK
jgi:hypothetical protein